jgi:hypothetical protein
MRNCKIVEDLWPLYLDDELNDESKQFVEEHLRQCTSCLHLPRDFNTPIPVPNAEEITPASPEKFLVRVKRTYQVASLLILVFLVVAIGLIYSFSDGSGQRRFQQYQQREFASAREQMERLNDVSPPAETLLAKYDIEWNFISANKVKNDMKIRYAMNIPTDIPDVSAFYPLPISHHRAFDTDSGRELPVNEVGDLNNLSLVLLSVMLTEKVPREISLQTPAYYLLLNGPSKEIPFRYEGDEETILLDETFIFSDVEFRLDTLELTPEKFRINYRQITPSEQVGVYQLKFSFDDRLGSSWHDNSMTPTPQAQDSKKSDTWLPSSPSKNWLLRIENIFHIIPPLEYTVEVNGQ